ncbi:MAG: hypothetical protein ACFB6R_11455 [Alphaproteobacteria bacterium]
MDDVYLEFISHGTSVKVCAVCARTGIEVVVVGPASAGQEQLSRVAVAKLRYVMGRNKARNAAQPPGNGRRGLVV